MKANFCVLGLAGGLLALSMSGATAGTIPYPNVGTTNPDTYNFTAASTGNLMAYFYGSTAGDSEYLNIYDTTTNAVVGSYVADLLPPSFDATRMFFLKFGVLEAHDLQKPRAKEQPAWRGQAG